MAIIKEYVWICQDPIAKASGAVDSDARVDIAIPMYEDSREPVVHNGIAKLLFLGRGRGLLSNGVDPILVDSLSLLFALAVTQCACGSSSKIAANFAEGTCDGNGDDSGGMTEWAILCRGHTGEPPLQVFNQFDTGKENIVVVNCAY